MIRLTCLAALLLLFTAMPATAKGRKAVKAARKAQKTAVAADTVSAERRRLADGVFMEAMVQRHKGNRTATFDMLRRCTELNPQAAEAYFFLAQYYNGLKDKDKALENIKRAADLRPDNHTYLETLAQAYVGSGRYDEAIDVMEGIVAREKSRDDVLSMLVQLYMQKDDYAKAIATLDRLETIEGKSERLSYAKSSIYTQKGDHKAAVEEMKRLADQYPNDLNYRGMYGDILLVNGEKEKALEVFGSILREEPDNRHALASLRLYHKENHDTASADSITRILLMDKDTDSATRIEIMRQEITENEQNGGDSTKILRLFDMMEAVPQENADVSELHAAYMNLKKMPQDSISRVLRHILTIEPDNAAARLQLVGYAWSREDRKTVIELCGAARQYNPDEMAFYYYQGMAYYIDDDYDSALSTFQNGIGVITDKSDPAIVSDFYSVMGELLYKKGRKEEAYAAYDSCLQWKDDNIGCLNNYAYYLSMDGRELEKAERMSYRTIEADPENANNLDTYAWILFLQGRTAEARVYIDQALKHDDDLSAVILEHAGDIHAVCGDMEKALELWNKAAVKDPENSKLKRKIKQKKYLK